MGIRIEDWLHLRYGLQVTLPNFFTLLCLGLAAAALVLLRYQRRYRLNERLLFNFLVLAVPLLYVGGKLVYWAQFPDASQRGLEFWLGGGTALYGGFLGLVAAALIAFRSDWKQLCSYLDGFGTALALGLCIGRLGCFLSGCNHGLPTDLPWGVRFPPGSHAFLQHVHWGMIEETSRLSLPVHPTQLYEAGIGLALFCPGLIRLDRRRFEGQVFVILLACYALFRFSVEWVRADHGGPSVGPFSFAQLFSLGLAAALPFLWRFLEARGRRPPDR